MADDGTDQGTVQIALRIAPDLRERIKAAAEANNRSVNKELTATLEERYPAPVPDFREQFANLLVELRNSAKDPIRLQAAIDDFNSIVAQSSEEDAKAYTFATAYELLKAFRRHPKKSTDD